MHRRLPFRFLAVALVVLAVGAVLAGAPGRAGAASVPGRPVVKTVTPGDRSARLSWAAPASDGGSPLTGYVVVTYVGSTALPARTFTSTATVRLIGGLTNGTTYRFRVAARNAIGRGPLSALSPPVTPVATLTSGPVIELFHGPTASFGAPGLAQPEVNVLGRVLAPAGLASLHARLGSGPPFPLGVGPDGRRLAAPGDFNVAIPATSLVPGANVVSVRAVDLAGRSATADVVVQWTPPGSWPLPYSADWAASSSLHAVAQPVDGHWRVSNGRLRPVTPGYDRMIAVGDDTWRSYDASVQVTVHRFDPAGYTSIAGGPGVGFIPHWKGHVPADARQPGWGFVNRFGALVWYRDKGGTIGERFEIRDGATTLMARGAAGRTLTKGVTYVFRLRVDAGDGAGASYALKAWPVGTAEPTAWDVVATLSPGPVPVGSLVLVAHHVDASFGKLVVTPRVAPAASA